MIRTEQFTLDGRILVRTYSDAGLQVCRDNQCWDEAIDPLEMGRTYTEGEPIQETEASAEELVDILLGGRDD